MYVYEYIHMLFNGIDCIEKGIYDISEIPSTRRDVAFGRGGPQEMFQGQVFHGFCCQIEGVPGTLKWMCYI